MNSLIIDEVKKYCDENGFKFRDFGDNIYVSTLMDEWIIKIHKQREHDNGVETLFMVKHINTSGNKSGKHHFHTQGYASDIHYIFNNIIIPHERYDGVYDEAFKIADILKEVL